MTTTTSPPRTVESYWRLAWQWQQERRDGHGYTCPCLACGGLRAYQRRIPLPIVVGGRRFLYRGSVRRPRERRP